MADPACRTVVLAVGRPIAPADLPGLGEKASALLDRKKPDVALCDVRAAEPDAVTVDALARLQLAARRRGCQVLLRHAPSELLDLLAFMGLRDVLPTES
jgi:hypothetical protein